MQGGQIMRLCGFWAYFRIFMRLFLLCGYAVIRIISFLDLPLFAKIPLILPNLSHFSLTIGFTFVISLAIQSIRSICESLFITLIIFLRILPTATHSYFAISLTYSYYFALIIVLFQDTMESMTARRTSIFLLIYNFPCQILIFEMVAMNTMIIQYTLVASPLQNCSVNW